MMKSSPVFLLGLVGFAIATALPVLNDEPVRILPPSWLFKIKSLRGPGCPDFNVDPTTAFTTRTTFGMNTVDGSEIYYWHIAYPHLHVDLAGEDHLWCETELSYTEYANYVDYTPGDAYRLRLHKNGTRMLATYELDEGVTANWEFTYELGSGKNITDKISLNGPYSSGQYEVQHASPVSKDPEIAPMHECGTGTIKFRTDLRIVGKEGKKGVVASEKHTTSEGFDGFYGAQQGFSYDFEKCVH